MSKHSWKLLNNGKQKCSVCGIIASDEEPYPQNKYTGCKKQKKIQGGGQ